VEVSVNSYIFNSAAAGHTVLVTETGVEPLQLVARTGTSTFLLGGSRANGGLTSGPDPYEMLGKSADIRVGPSGDGEDRYAAEALSSYRDDLEHIAGDDPRTGFD
jgi:hypothetical protein